MVSDIKNAISEISIDKEQLISLPDIKVIDEELVEVLKIIADQNDEGFSVEELAQSLNTKKPKMQYYLECLYAKGLILISVGIYGSKDYILSSNGRSFLVEKGLL